MIKQPSGQKTPLGSTDGESIPTLTTTAWLPSDPFGLADDGQVWTGLWQAPDLNAGLVTGPAVVTNVTSTTLTETPRATDVIPMADGAPLATAGLPADISGVPAATVTTDSEGTPAGVATFTSDALPAAASDESFDGADMSTFFLETAPATLSTVTNATAPGPVGGQGSLLLVTGLARATSPVLTSAATSDDTIAGRAIDTAAITSLTASIDGGAAVSEPGAIGAGGSFTLTPTVIAALAGGTLANGPHTVVVNAHDASGNTTSTGVSFTLNNVAPTLSAGLMHITGTTTLAQTIGATRDPTVAGSGTDPAGLISLFGTLDGVATFTDLTGDIGGNGAFTLTPTILNSLAGGVLPDGHHSLVLQATDTAGNVTTQTVNFTLETQLGVPVLALAASDQSGGPTTAASSAVTLLGTTTPGAIATLTNTGAIATAGATGLFQFTNVPIGQSGTAIAVQVTDLAGNSGNASLNVTRANPGGTDPVIEWDAITRLAIATDASPPTVASRALAIESLSVYNAVAAINGTPGFLSSLTAPAGANAQAAAIAAADAALDALYPAQAAGFDAQAAADLAAIPDGLNKTEGIAVGRQSAAAMVAMRANDGSANTVTDLGSTTPGQWQPTGPAFAPALQPQFANVTPFALQSPNQFLPAPPPDITSQAYADAVNQTFLLGELNSTTRTADETQAARFWNGQTGTDTPPGEWNLIASTVAQAQGDGLSQDALLFAELNVATADATIATWNGKFTYNAWRPITLFTDPAASAINPAVDTSPTWAPLLATPNHPEYPEGDGTIGNAAATVLANFFGDNTSFSVSSLSFAGVTRSFTSFSSAAEEAAMSRIWAGIHFSFSANAALALGSEVGTWTVGAFNSGADTTPPKVTLTSTTGGITNQDPTVTGVVSSSFGVTALDAILNNGTTENVPVAADGSFSFTVDKPLDGSADGSTTVGFVAVDPAGNESPVVNFTFSLVTEAPTITFAQDSVVNGATIGAGAVLDGSIGLETGDTLRSLTYAFDGAPPVSVPVDLVSGTFDQELDLTMLAPGQHALKLVAQDAAGNVTTDFLSVTYKLPPLTVEELTPDAGATDIGVTTRPRIEFSRAVNTDTLTGANFFATDSTGAVLPATVVPFTDGTGAWLLPTGDWPGASTITLHVNGQGITAAADGAQLDAAGNGTPGSILTETYSTVSSASVSGTTITGIVVDPGPDGTPLTPDDVRSSVGNSSVFSTDTWKLPIAGATVYILGQEQNAVRSAADGSFTLTNAPVGDVKVVIDGRTATNAPPGYFFPEMVLDITVKAGVANTIAGAMGTPQQAAAMAADPADYLPRVAIDSLTPVSSTAPTTIVAPPDADLGSGSFTMTQQQLSELSLTVQPNSMVDANGNPIANPMVGIAPVPASLVADMLPPGLIQHSFDITIQAPGAAVFTAGASLTMPNVFGLAPGEKTYILSFDHTTGRLVIYGTATASADGATVTTDPGTTIDSAGWHGMTPPGSNGNGKVGDLDDPTHGLAHGFLDALGFMSDLFGDVVGGIGSIATVLQADGTPALPALNVLATIADVTLTFADANNPNKTNGDVAYDVVKDVLDVASFIPPVALPAAALRLGLGLFDLFTSSGPTVINDVNSANGSHQGDQATTLSDQLSTLSAQLASVSGSASTQQAQLLAQLIADQQQINTEAAFQRPIIQQVLNDFLVFDPLRQLIDPTRPNDGLTTDQAATLRSVGLDIANQAALLNGHPSVLQMTTQFVNDAQALLANMASTFFTVISPPQPRFLAVEAGGAAVAGGASVDPSVTGSDQETGAATVQSDAGVALAPVAAADLGVDTGAAQRASATMYAALQAADGSVVRQSFIAGSGYNFFLAPSTYYTVTIYDPTTGKVGAASFKSSPSGQDTQIPLVGLVDDDEAPGADGLTARQAFVIGVNNSTASNLVPGITDLSAIQQGLFNGSVLPGTTGIAASLPLQGSAQAVVTSGSLGGQTTFAYLATGTYGLAVVDISNPFKPVILGQIALGGNATALAVSNALGVAVVANGSNLTFVNVADPSALSVLQTVPISATAVQIIGGTVYANSGGTIDSFDAATGILLQTLGLGGATVTGIATQGTTLYTMDSNHVLRVIDTSSGEMVLDGSVALPAGGGGLVVGPNNVVYVAAANSTTTGDYLTVDVSNPAAPALIQGVDNPGIAGAAIAVNGSGIGLTVQAIQEPPPNPGVHNVVDLINTSNPANTGQLQTRFELPAQPFGVAIGEGIGFIADGTAGLQVVNYLPPDTAGVVPVINSVTGPADVDPNTAGIQVFDGVPVSVSASVSDDVQVRNVELLVNGSVAANVVTFPFALTATLPSIASLGTNIVTLQVEAFDTGGNTAISTPVQVQLVPDTRPLLLLNQSVSEGAILSQFSRTISMTFSKPLNPATVTTASFEVIDQAGSVVPVQSLVLGDNDQAVLMNFGTLAVGSYRLEIAAPSVTDDNGVALGSGTLVTDFAVQAFSEIFTNTAGGSWNTASNWNTGIVPAATDSVFIGNAIGAPVNYDGNTDSVAKLVADGTGQFNVTAGTLTITNLLQVGDLMTVGLGALSAPGSVSVSGLGDIQVNNRSTSLDNVSIAQGGVIEISNNNFLFAGGAYANAGTIGLNSGNNSTELVVVSDLTLSGGGQIQFSDNPNNFLVSNGAAVSVINQGDTISGAGQIGDQFLSVVNGTAGVIDASAGNALSIALSGGTLTNTGTIESTSANGGLQLVSLTIDGTGNNNAGVILASGANNHVDLHSATVIGGTLRTVNGGLIRVTDRGSEITNAALDFNSNIHVTNNNFLTLAGTLTNRGTVFLDSGNNTTELVAAGAATLSGGGQIQLSDNPANVLGSNGAAASFVNVNNTISGAGQIGDQLDPLLSMVNGTAGIIDATAGNALVITLGGGTLTNTGTIEATSTSVNNGGLRLLSSTIDNTGSSNAGVILSAGTNSHVNLQSATVLGGTLRTANGGVIQAVDRGSVLDNATIAANSNVHVTNNNFLFLVDTLINHGTVFLDSGNNATELVMSGSVTLTGTGVVQLSDNAANSISGAAGAVLTNINNTILGSGQIGDGMVTVNNLASGTIDGTGIGSQLILTGSNAIGNAGLIEDTGSAGLNIRNTTVNNTGTIKAGIAGSVVDLQSAVINGGVLSATNGGVLQAIDRGSVLTNVTVQTSTGGSLIVTNNNFLFLQGALTNQGTVALASGNNTTELAAIGLVTLTGGGQIRLSDNANNFLVSNGTAASFINVNNTISGGGQIGDQLDPLLSVVNGNLGVIDATLGTALAIRLGGGTLTNTGTIESTSTIVGNGGLLLSGSTIDNTGSGNAGVILATGVNSHVDLQSATILGGTLITANGGLFHEIDRGSALNDVTISAGGVVAVDNNQYLTLQGTVINQGTIQVNSGNNDTRLIASGLVQLTGGGAIRLSDNGANLIGGGAGAVLTNANNTISGSGTIGDGVLSFVNQAAGVVNATGGNRLAIAGGVAVANSGLMEATGSGGLGIFNTTVNNTGTIEALAAGSHVDLASATINGGVLATANGGLFHETDRGSTLNGVTIGAGGVVAVDNNQYLALQGIVTDQGTIQVNSGNNDTRLIIVPGLTLTGGGAVQLSDNAANSITSAAANTAITILNDTMSGAGTIGDANMTITVGASGTIDATGGNALTVATAANTVTNLGVLESTGTGGLTISGGGGVANGGTIWANGSGLFVAGAVTGTGAGKITGGATLRVGGSVAAGQTISFDAGSTGTLRLDDSLQFGGTVSGLAVNGSNALDLSDIQFVNKTTTTATFNGGTLTVTDGTHTAHIALAGDFTGHTFVTSSDGHNGTTVVDPVTAGPLASLSEVLSRSVIMPADLLPGSAYAAASGDLRVSSGVGGAGALPLETAAMLPAKTGWMTT